MISVFKQLARSYKHVKEDLKKAVSFSEDQKMLQDKKELLESIINYLNSYDWMSRKDSIDKVRTWLTSGYDYELVCRTYDISYEKAKNAIKWANAQFKKKIGEETLEMIEQGKLDEARCAFYVASGQIDLENLIVEDFKPFLPQAEYLPYDLEECLFELKVLQAVSKAKFKTFADRADKNKMAYLLHLLTGESKIAYLLRPAMVELLNGNMSAAEVVQEEKDLRIANNMI